MGRLRAAEGAHGVLIRRAAELRERMDDPDCDPHLLERTYAQFSLVNRLVSGWERLIRRFLLERLVDGSTVLDIGCGGGDLVRRLAHWGSSRGVALKITGLDPDPRALRFAAAQHLPAGVEYLQGNALDLASSGRRFDVVLSNHVLHHLPTAEIGEFLEVSAALSSGLVLHNDLRRHAAAWLAFNLARPFFLRSYIVGDGLRSIRRAFTPAELRPLLPTGWRVEGMSPFRNLVILER